ncbi:ectoine/hydroxyectoine ABC transporter substrate-binding protein EhuB [Pseudonocardia nigra]|uniref:ectoine/hydroxyectoine ABC transporter substrate-binding protein EhuB n=1 Tax=Pseudonocardia nigra TaxID=1921578 RepID=UPI001C5F4A4C|nr:ectoine/hydroxyectoine ABC transporter substrate-binding protein EhuB [Pseudonocardia nigra]
MRQQPWSRRDFLRRTAAAGAVALGGATVLGACQQVPQAGGGGGEGGAAGTLERARQAGTINIGIAGEQPYGFTTPDGTVTGEAPEVARAVMEALGIPEINAQQVEFSALIPSLNANRYDMVCAGMNITPERCGQAAFSIPDYSALTAFLVPPGNPEQVATFEDVATKNLQLAVLGAAVEQDYAEAAGVQTGNIQVFETQNALLQAVTDGRVYCAALTDISLNWLVNELNPDAAAEVTDGFRPVVNGEEIVSAGGFVFRQADNDLREAFNTELAALHESGRWVEIASPFGFSEDNLPAEGLTTEQLCSA